MKFRSTLAAIAVAGAALTVATPALADAVVVRSTGPSAASYPVGRRLPPADRVVLRAGDRVVLVGEGSTRTLSGPGNFPVRAATQASQGAGSTLVRYLSTTGSGISRTGAIRLNWRLVHLPLELIDYVIAHETAHLVEMNHSPRFWKQVERLCPDWHAARDALKQQGAALPLL